MILRSLLLVFLTINDFHDLSDARHIGQEIIRVTQHSPKPRARRDLDSNLYQPASGFLTGSDFPEHMEFTLHLKDGDKKLDLWKHRTLQDITVKNDEGVVKFDEAKTQIAAYQDTVTHSAIIVDCGHSVDFCTLAGSFYHFGEKFNLKLLNNSLVSYNVTQAKSDFSPKSTGRLVPDGVKTPGYQSTNSGEQQLDEEIMDHLKRNGHKIQKRSFIYSTCNILQINIFADFSVYEYYLAREHNNALSAEIQLVVHYLFLFTEVDLRFKCLGELAHPICFRVFLSSIRFETISSGYFTVDNDYDGYVDALAVLDNCRYKRDPSLHGDYTLCTTKLEIEYQNDPSYTEDHGKSDQHHGKIMEISWNFVEEGITYFGVICVEHIETYTVGYARDIGDDTNLNIASLLLGALHVTADTPNREPECNSSFLYIAAEFNDPPVVLSTIQNPWRFSNCSIAELKSFFNFLNTGNYPNGNCLKVGSISEEDFEKYSLTKPLPGKIFTLDYQCQLTYGLSSFAAIGPGETSIFDVDDICYQGVYCDVNGDNTYRSRIYNGSPCGCKEICVKNLCVREFNIPLGGDCLGCCECADNNSICDCETRKCVCDKGFYDDNLFWANGTCVPLKGINESCPFDEACRDKFAVCDNTTYVCVCMEGYIVRDDVCVKVCPSNRLPSILNGTYVPQDIIVGSIANLHCDYGFATNTKDTCAVCGTDGNYTVPVALCVRDCGCPPEPPNGDYVLTTDSTTEGSMATLECDLGFGTSATVKISCENTPKGWSYPSENCTIRDCEIPLPTVTNGYYVTTGSGMTTVGSLGALKCLSGYKPMSEDTCILCQPNGTWSPPLTGCVHETDINENADDPMIDAGEPKDDEGVSKTIKSENCCIYGDCKSPPQAVFGSFTLTDPHNTTLGATAQYDCCPGYELESVVTIMCEEAGWSSPSENCTLKDCSSTPTIANGSFDANDGTTVGSIATLTCEENFAPSSSEVCIVCELSGNWSNPMVECIVDCGCPPEVDYGEYILNNDTCTTLDATAELHCCPEAMLMSPPVLITCQSSGHWSMPSENCTLRDCSSTPTIANGSFDANDGTTVGSVATLTCEENFAPSSSEVCIVCELSGNWSNPMVECIVDCGCPPETDNGKYILNNDTCTTLDATAELHCCPEAMLMSPPVLITCQSSGHWSMPSENCTLRDCSSTPTIANGLFDANDGTTVGSIATLTCEENFAPSSSEVCIVCERSGNWSNPMVECIADCGCPPEVDYGEYILNNDTCTTLDATAELHCCPEAMLMSPPVLITCQSSGHWSMPSENCTLRDCSSTPTIANGLFDANDGTTVGSVATLTCEENFAPSSSEVCIVCELSGNWSNPMVECIADCGCPPEVDYGEYILNNDTCTTLDATAELHCCPEAMLMSPPVLITCQSSGHWSMPSENCTLRDCGSPPNITNGNYEALRVTTVGEIAVLSCAHGYIPDGLDVTVICTNDGNWSEPSVSCKRDCGCPPEAQNGAYNLTIAGSTTLGATALLSCCPAYDTQTVVMITCQNTGWSDTAENCSFKVCSDTTLPNVTNGEYIKQGDTVGSLAILKCGNLKSPDSNETCVVCQMDGKWSSSNTKCITDCGLPPTTASEGFVLLDGGTNLGDTARVCCTNKDDVPVGGFNATISCTPNGWHDPSEIVCRGCPSGWTRNPEMDTCYYLEATSVVNKGAEDICNNFDSTIYDSNLVKIDTASESHFVTDLMDNFSPQPKTQSNTEGFWIGLYQTGTNNVSETWLPIVLPLSTTGFQNWNKATGEPNMENQFCTMAFQDFHYRWIDIECLFQGNGTDDRKGFPLCEIDL